jgi:hypothetical protein
MACREDCWAASSWGGAAGGMLQGATKVAGDAIEKAGRSKGCDGKRVLFCPWPAFRSKPDDDLRLSGVMYLQYFVAEALYEFL